MASKTEFAGRSASVQTLRKACQERIAVSRFTRRSAQPAADAGVVETGGQRGFRVEQIAAVHQDRRCHRARQLSPDRVAELLPLRHQHQRVGLARALERRIAVRILSSGCCSRQACMAIGS